MVHSFWQWTMKKYLFVDDDGAFLEVLRLFFGSTPHVYLSDVRHVSEVLQRNGPFDVMITDYDMPYQNGLGLAEWVNQYDSAMPILVLSGHEKPDLLPSFVIKWMKKPISLDVLAEEIAQCQKS
jgi:DNA-binding NtrC family response regulator